MSAGKNNGPIINPGLCRCCRNLKKCRTLTHEYVWMQNKEVYSDMFMDCFGLLLSHLDGEPSECCVCATCVVRLRDACAFRTQVLKCEEAFLKEKIHINTDDSSKTVEVKYEPLDSDVDSDSRCTMDCSEDTAAETNAVKSVRVDLKPEPGDRGFARATCRLPMEGDSSEHSSEDISLKEAMDKERLVKAEAINATPKRVTKRRRVLKQKSDGRGIERRERKIGSGVKKKLINNRLVPETSKKNIAEDPSTKYNMAADYLAQDNAITIIENSYIYPFKNRVNIYYCFYCKERFSHPDQLSEHTWSHDPTVFKNFMWSKRFHYVDITRIDCRLCSLKIDSVDAFKTHVSVVHKKEIHFNISDKLLLFRLRFTELQCTLCDSVFNDFNGLNKHMVKHFSNYTCDVCGVCFLEEFRLMLHLRSHRADEERHPCEVCGKVFKNKFYKKSHVENIHNRNPTISCPKCDSLFLSDTLKNRHLIEVHEMRKTFPCNMCEKVYDRRKTLTEHQRRFHLKRHLKRNPLS